MIRRMCLTTLMLGIALGLTPAAFAQPAKDALFRVGMAKSFFNDMPQVLIDIGVEPFPKLLKETTGLDGALSTRDDAATIAKKLDAGDIDIGVFHGHELAWAQQKYPKLTPLLVVTNAVHQVRVHILVPADSPVKTVADLRGKAICLPIGTKEHVKVYVERTFGDNNQPAKTTKSPKNPIVCLNGLCSKECDAVAVDTIGLDFYKEVNGPRFFKNLRVLVNSEPFPQPVLAYKQGAAVDARIEQFRKGLLTAHKIETGRELMQLWKIDRFDEVPATYAKSLAEVLKEYPPR